MNHAKLAEKAELTDWKDFEGFVWIAIRIPNPDVSDIVSGCWGDAPEDLEKVQELALDNLAPDHDVVGFECDENGEYVLLMER